MRRKFRNHRSQRGAVILYVFVCMGLFIALAFPVIAFFSNMSAQLTIQNDCGEIARQIASVVDDRKYWLDAPRPGYAQDQEHSLSIAKAAGHAMCDALGMSASDINISFLNDGNGQHTVCKLSVDARKRYPLRTNVCGFDFAQYFPGEFSVTNETVHAPTQPYSLIHMDAPHSTDQSTRRPLGFNERDVAVIPTYGFFYDAVAGSKAPGTPYGKGLANMQPENFMAMNHYHLKKSDVEYVMQTGNDVLNNSWHPGRLYDGKESAVMR